MTYTEGSLSRAELVPNYLALDQLYLRLFVAARRTASPTAQRMLKYAFNAIDDGLVGQQLFAGESTRLAYMTDEAVEGRDAFLQRRDPDWTLFPWYY